MANRASREQGSLADGSAYRSWERPAKFSKTYYVDGGSPEADDAGPGTQARPFRTVSAAAAILRPGQRVVIAGGVYRESVHPARGGTSPTQMISYEAAPGAKVVVKGSALLKDGWRESSGWNLRMPKGQARPRIWQIRLSSELFDGCNPFALINIIQDRFWLNHKVIPMDTFFQRRGMLFVDGRPLVQVDLFHQLNQGPGRFWIEHNGQTLHVRLPDDDSPDAHEIEATTREQVFAPHEHFLSFIRVKGLTLAHAGNGFPVPQRGLLSTSRGHHWIIEDCTIEWANSVGIDCGKECWHATNPETPGHHIIRRNTIRHCGICGIAGITTQNMLVEDNLIEHCATHDAERMYESAGVKFHHAKNLLFRRNVIRHLPRGCGIWLDCGNINCRVTGNTFADIASVSGAIHLEGNHDANRIDHNIIFDSRTQPGQPNDGAHPNAPLPVWGGRGIYVQGTDKTTIDHNFIANCEGAGFRCDVIAKRIIGTRGGTARGNRFTDNVVVDCRKAAVELENEHSFLDGNLYANMPAGCFRIELPDFPQYLDLETWQEFHGWDERGAVGVLNVECCAESLCVKVSEDGQAIRLPKGCMPGAWGRVVGEFAGDVRER